MEQSNSAYRLDCPHGTGLFKLFRTPDLEPHREAELLGLLSGQREKTSLVPQYWGELRLQLSSGQRYCLGVASRYHLGAKDAFTWVLAELKRAGPSRELLAWTSLLGARTRDLHRCLAAAPFLEVQRFSSLAEEGRRLVRNLTELRADISRGLAEAPAQSKLTAGQPGAHGGQQRASLKEFLALSAPEFQDQEVEQQVLHGDLHLGQVLVDGEQLLFIDFEGEPSRSVAERWAPRSPWADVAGLLRSFDYALTLAGFQGQAADEVREQLEQGLLRAYCQGPLLAEQRQLLQFFVLEKALYELRYEWGHRPDWIQVPLGALLRLWPQPAPGATP